MRDVIIRAALRAGAAGLFASHIAFAQSESLSISGAPPTTVQIGHAYAFTPHAVASGPVAPHFEIQNLPHWASFGWSGQLTGSPAASDVGTYANIRISIVAGTTRASLPVFSITVQPGSGATASATVSWTAPKTNLNGTALTNLAGYRIYTGTAPSHLASIAVLNNARLASYVIKGLTPGLHYFAVTAVNSIGLESPRSAVVAATLR